jgi:hypothetical protein
MRKQRSSFTVAHVNITQEGKAVRAQGILNARSAKNL